MGSPVRSPLVFDAKVRRKKLALKDPGRFMSWLEIGPSEAGVLRSHYSYLLEWKFYEHA